jgi:hypothetical protein
MVEDFSSHPCVSFSPPKLKFYLPKIQFSFTELFFKGIHENSGVKKKIRGWEEKSSSWFWASLVDKHEL